MYSRIIVPLDGSEVAESALPNATGLARALNIPLLLVRVVDITHSPPMVGSGVVPSYELNFEMIEEERVEAREYLDNMVQRLSGDGLEVQRELREGPVARRIVESASPGDLITMASHGRTGLSRWFLGSVAEEVMRQARTPVLLHREQSDTDDA